MSATVALDWTTWDLTVDDSGNIATLSNPESQAQDVACRCRTFYGECWYDNTQGIKYWENILGHFPPINVLKQYYTDEALAVSGVVDAKCTINTYSLRKILGQLTFINEDGEEAGISL